MRSLFLSLLSLGSAAALSLSEITAETPTSEIVAAAMERLTAGKTADALSFFDSAISRDPSDYASLLQRGSVYLTLGRVAKAVSDFDRILELRPGLEHVLVRRAQAHLQTGNWASARADYTAAKKPASSDQMNNVQKGEKAEAESRKLETRREWKSCAARTDEGLRIAPRSISLRSRRIDCLLAAGEISAAVDDMSVLAIHKPDSDLFARLAATMYFYQDERTSSASVIRRCIQFDPESDVCRKVIKRQKIVTNLMAKYEKAKQRSNLSAANVIAGTAAETGVADALTTAIRALMSDGILPQFKLTDSILYQNVVRGACEGFVESSSYAGASKYCPLTAEFDDSNVHAKLHEADRLLRADDYEAVIRVIDNSKLDPNHPKVRRVYQEARRKLQKQNQKDYYKILGVGRTASQKEIKRAYKVESMKNHPDKVKSSDPAVLEAATQRMIAVNQAYEVLSNAELKEKFDSGIDPNDPTANQPMAGQNPFGAGSPHFNFFQQAGPNMQFQFFSGGHGQQKPAFQGFRP